MTLRRNGIGARPGDAWTLKPGDTPLEDDCQRRWLGVLAGVVTVHCGVQIITIGLSLHEVQVTQAVALLILGVALAAGSFAGWATAAGSRSDVVDNHPGPSRGARLVIRWIVGFACLVYTVSWIASVLGRDRSWDGNGYHIPPIHVWAMKGYVHWIDAGYDGASLMNGYPKGAELLAFVLVKAFDTNHVLTTASLLFLPMGSLAIAILALTLGSDRWGAIASGAMWLLVPTNVAQTTTTYVDSSYASCVATALALAVAAVHRMTVTGSRVPWGLGWALGGAIGLATAMKSTGLGFAVGLLGWLAVVFVAHRPRDFDAVGLLARSRLWAGVALIALGVGGYWYIRNWMIAENPVYPIAVRVAGRAVFRGEELRSVVDANQIPDEFQSLPNFERVLLAWAQRGLWTSSPAADPWQDAVYANDSRLGGLGYLWLWGCVPATIAIIAMAVATRARPALVVLATVAPIVLFLFWIQPFNWWARFTLWLYALGLPCLGAIARPILQGDGRRWTRAVAVWLGAVAAVAVAEGAVAAFVTIAGPVGANADEIVSALRERYIDDPVGYVEPLQALQGSVFDTILTGEDGVAVGYLSSSDTSKELVLGELCQPIGARTVLPIDQDASDDDVSDLVSAGVRYVILDDLLPVPEAVAARAQQIDRPPGFVVVTLGSANPGDSEVPGA